MDLLPDRVIRLALLGQEERLLESRTIWVCSGCMTCTSRCPNAIDIAGVMDWLKEEAARRGRGIAETGVAQFHRLFLESVRAGGGRLAESRLLQRFTLFKVRRQPDWAELKQNLHLGWQLWRRGRVRLSGPPALRGKAEINDIFRKADF
jgi:heterodisulfide reductase subunit C